MSIRKLFLGIDTSCYTTSVAAEIDGQMISLKKPLDVRSGECGLRQSEAFFQHSKNLPVLFEELKGQFSTKNYDEIVVSVSSRPRSVEGSYMPVFCAGQGYARAICAIIGAKLIETSHQDGHIMAAMYSCKKYSIMEKPFLTYHVSGGTTELLLAERSENGFKCSIVGGTKDLPAGQFVDRIGVKIGYDFPCGKFMDYSACEFAGDKPKVKTCVKDGYINFSGEETRYQRMLDKDCDREYIAYCTMKCIADSLKKSIEFAKEKYNVDNVLMVGGVSSSKFIRNEFSDISGVFFAEPELCCDNAVGVCVFGRLKNEGLFGQEVDCEF